VRSTNKAASGPRLKRTIDPASIPDLIPPHPTIPALQKAAKDCRACDLWRNATQTVFGEGAREAAIMLIGEQPGDQEDRLGRPFVGPAGRILDQALAEAGIDRGTVYVTNVVKHFRWTAAERGKRRIHKKPRASEIQACRPWLDAELNLLKPKVVVCLGASAAQALLGKDFRVTRDRGKVIKSTLAALLVATVHPSSILRAQDDESRQIQMKGFVDDLRTVKHLLGGT
jgi:uracil-DNA glycosylase family protein